ncbi:MAG: peptide ABC transporter substrate-binding protein [Deltaproteobacteria bacterium]|nr:peptide ABC transporter substrate-binding protein [Deltaproteobacteria bacterium]
MLRALLLCFVLWATLISSSSADPMRLRLRLSSGPTDLDWSTAGSQITSFVFANIMDGLTELDGTLIARPALAKSIDVSPDGKIYTFRLREGVKWSDGKPLRAEDFITSWQRLLDPLDVKPFAVMLSNVVGAMDYSHGKLKDFTQVGIKVVQPNGIEVTLVSAQPYFLELLASPVLFPMRKDLLEAHGRRWSEPGKTAVLGPYLPVSYEKGKRLVLRRNAGYYGRAPHIDSIDIRIIGEDAIATAMFERGELDVVIPVNFKESESLKNTPVFRTARQFRTRFLYFNCESYPFSMPNARKAVAMAIDRSKLAYPGKQGFPSTEAFTPNELFPEGADIKVPFNLKAAKEALAEAGVVAEKTALEIVALSNDENAIALNEVADQLRQNLGLKVEVKLLARDFFINQITIRAAPLFYLARGAEYPDLNSFMSSFLSDSGLNTMRWKNPKYDELVKNAAQLPKGSERTAAYHEALELLVAKAYAVIPLHFEHFSYLVSSRVKDFMISPLGAVNLRTVQLTR